MVEQSEYIVLKIAFDIHGTLDKYDQLMDLAWFLNRKRYVSSETEVWVISGPTREVIKKRLPQSLKNTVKIVSVVDYLKSKDVKMWQDANGEWWCKDDEWWSSKGQICKEFGIDILVDNEIKYKKYMPDNTIFLWVASKGGKNEDS